MGGSEEERRRAAAMRVLELLTEAIDLMDAHELPPQAGAHVDLGRQQLRVEFGLPLDEPKIE